MPKFSTLFSTLNPKEMRRFAEFGNSPYFNKNEEVKLYIQYYVEFTITRRANKLSDETMFSLIYPNEPYKREKLYYLRSDALILLEKFLIYEQIDPNKGIPYLSLLYYYAQNGLTKYFEEGHQTWQVKRKTALFDADFYYEAYMEERLMQFESTRNRERRETQLFALESSNLNAFYYMRELENLIYLWDNINVLRSNTNKQELVDKIDSTIKRIEENCLLANNLFIQIYILSLEILKREDGFTYFEKLKALLEQKAEELPNDFLRNEYIRMKNFCIRQINAGKKEYYQTQFELYQDELKLGLLYNEKGKMAASSFRNLLMAGLKLGKQEWAEAFLQQHRNRLMSEDATMMYHFCQAKMLFEQKRYMETKAKLYDVKLRDPLMGLDIRRTIIKCYCELEDFAFAMTELEKFRVYVFRKKVLSDRYRDRNRQFCNILNRILNHTPGEYCKKESLLKELTEMPNEEIYEKQWLLKKIQYLR